MPVLTLQLSPRKLGSLEIAMKSQQIESPPVPLDVLFATPSLQSPFPGRTPASLRVSLPLSSLL